MVYTAVQTLVKLADPPLWLMAMGCVACTVVAVSAIKLGKVLSNE